LFFWESYGDSVGYTSPLIVYNSCDVSKGQ
jgi:hypothetical protein